MCLGENFRSFIGENWRVYVKSGWTYMSPEESNSSEKTSNRPRFGKGREGHTVLTPRTAIAS